MARTEVTDEILTRALMAYYNATKGQEPANVAAMRTSLEAALHPPPEPEVVITREMSDAGGLQYKHCRESEWRAQSWSVNDFARSIYRAMRRLKPVSKSIVSPSGGWLHSRKGDGPTVGDMTRHRRAGDAQRFPRGGEGTGWMVNDQRTGPKDRREASMFNYSRRYQRGGNTFKTSRRSTDASTDGAGKK